MGYTVYKDGEKIEVGTTRQAMLAAINHHKAFMLSSTGQYRNLKSDIVIQPQDLTVEDTVYLSIRMR